MGLLVLCAERDSSKPSAPDAGGGSLPKWVWERSGIDFNAAGTTAIAPGWRHFLFQEAGGAGAPGCMPDQREGLTILFTGTDCLAIIDIKAVEHYPSIIAPLAIGVGLDGKCRRTAMGLAW